MSVHSLNVPLMLGIPVIRLDILSFVFARGEARTSEVAGELGISINTARNHINVLCALGIITRTVKAVPGGFRPAACYTVDSRRLEEVRWQLFEAFPDPESDGLSQDAHVTCEGRD